MSTYVLIHGSWHGGWCWDKVAPLLEKEGRRVETPDLPGHGNDKTPIPEVTLNAYVERVGEVLNAQDEPVILVGHSMGGVIISQAAEHNPGKIKTLVYVTGFLMKDGDFLLQYAQADTEGTVLPNLVMAEDQSYALVKDEAIAPGFYHDCSEEDVAWAKSLLVPQAAAPLTTPIQITAEGFGQVPRVYIECLQDKAISPAMQKKMYTATPCEQVISMDTSHSPFLSAPEELAKHLLSLS